MTTLMTVASAPLAPVTTRRDIDVVDFRLGRWRATDVLTPDHARVLVVSIEGSLETQSRDTFKSLVLDELHAGRRRLVLDLTACGYLDSAALGALLSLTRKVQQARGRLVLCGLNDDLATLFELTRMAMVFDIAPSLMDALAVFEARVVT